MDNGSPHLAVLIDAENAQVGILEELLSEIANVGVTSVRRVYGDFTHPAMSSWRDKLLANAIHPVQQYRNTAGKNASDCAMIIDAMDLLHSGKFDGFCIVSSDSDFTRLATRIREEGVKVYGYGEQKTPKSFISACNRFTYTEVLRKANSSKKLPPSLLKCLREAVELGGDEDGWAQLGSIGKTILNRFPDFDSRLYGFPKLVSLVEGTGAFEVERRGAGTAQAVFVRSKS